MNPADVPVDPRSNLASRIGKLIGTLDLRADLYGTKDIGRAISVPAASQPYSGSCWPMPQNGIDWRWNRPGILSPAEKYAALLLPTTAGKQLVEWVQANQGTGVANEQSYYGICQGWVAAAILEHRPYAPVLVKEVIKGGRITLQSCSIHDQGKKGVTCMPFLKSDIAGLLAEVYSAPEAMALGTGCASQQVNFTYGAGGKIAQPSLCKNDAATLFVLATNFIKRGQLAFAVIFGDALPVWTQPAFGYQIGKFDVVDATTAAQIVGGPGMTKYTYNPNARGFRHVVLTLSLAASTPPMVDPNERAVQTRTYEMILELDAKNLIVGGQWAGQSQTDHPAGYWMPLGPGTRAPSINLSAVRALLDLSDAGDIGGGSAGGLGGGPDGGHDGPDGMAGGHDGMAGGHDGMAGGHDGMAGGRDGGGPADMAVHK